MMTRLLALVITMATVGCGLSPTTPEEPAGPVFRWSGATPEEETLGEALWVETRECMARYSLSVPDAAVRGIVIEVVPEAFRCGEVWAAGCTWTGSPPRITVSRLWFNYALPHEYVNLIWHRTGHRFSATPDNPFGDDWSRHPFAECDPNTH